jgi:hypothetical protein
MKDSFLVAIKFLAGTLAENHCLHNGNGSRPLLQALGRVETALREHTAEAYSPTGLLHLVDMKRHALSQQVKDLCREHSELLDRIRALQNDIRRRRDHLPSTNGTLRHAPSSRFPERSLKSAEEEIRTQTELLLADLNWHWQEEADLIIESVIRGVGGRFRLLYCSLPLVAVAPAAHPGAG